MLITLGHRILPSLSLWSTAGSLALYPATDAVNSVRSSMHQSITNDGFQCLLRQGRNIKAAEKGQHNWIKFLENEDLYLLPKNCSLLICVCACIHTGRGATNISMLKPVQRQEISLYSWVVYKNPHCHPGCQWPKKTLCYCNLSFK